jgi:hypothetical protein
MNEYTNDIDEDWGFYVDIEKENIEIIFNQCQEIQYQHKKLSTCYQEISIYHNITNIIIKLSSITLATICLTYFIRCILSGVFYKFMLVAYLLNYHIYYSHLFVTTHHHIK